MNQKYSLNNAWMKLAPVGQSFFEQLIHYCTTQGDQAENYALEIKGADVNPADKVGGAKIAKFIIGASNRDPIKARDFFAGHAIMLVGLGNGSAEGIDQVELLRINNVVEKYFGDQSPRWDIQWLDLPTNSAKKILAIIVAPPRSEIQSIFPIVMVKESKMVRYACVHRGKRGWLTATILLNYLNN